jgi:mannose-1-phosphate guanylyltransferase
MGTGGSPGILGPMSDASLPIDGFYSVIPAGGVGSRLWPLSRADAPKFLHDLTGSGQTLLKDTWDRLAPLSGEQRVMVVTGRAHRAAVEAQLPALADENIVLESEPRDSTAAIGLAAAILERREPGVVIGSFAADHVISGDALFRSAVADAVAAARAGFIATIGITPTEPAVGFGYIECGGPLQVPGAERVEAVSNFVEKPDLETAKRYLEGGDHLWNAGMFIAKASTLLDELARTKPDLHAGLLELAEAWDDPATRGPAVDRIWPTIEKIAIDYSVAEPAAAAGRLAVIRGHFQWDDVGDFASLAKLNTAGRSGELAILGENARVLADASSGIVVSRSNRVISLIGVHDIVVVDTPDALLVTTSEHAQRVKAVVDALRLGGSSDVL